MQTYRLDQSAKIPRAASIRSLRYKPGTDYWSGVQNFSSSAIKGLSGVGITTVGDLKDYTKKGLEALPGIGYASAGRLITAFKKSSPDIKPSGWPHEVSFTIPVPDDCVKLIGDMALTEGQVSSALSGVATSVSVKTALVATVQAKVKKAEAAVKRLRLDKEALLSSMEGGV